MVTNFREWLSLHVSDATATRYASTVSTTQHLFPTLAPENKLLDALKEYTYTRAPVATMMMLTGDTPPPDDIDVGQLAVGTVYTVVHGMMWYTRFMGYEYHEVWRFAQKISYCTRHTAQSTVLGSCIYTPVLLRVHNRLREALQTARGAIDARIARFLSHRSLAESEHSLRAFGLDHLRPFLELELRVHYAPLTIQQVQELRRPHGPLVHEWCQLQYTEDRSAIVLLVPIGRAGTRHTKAVPVALSPRCSMYVWFYMTYCAPSARQGGRLFLGARGGRWLDPLRDVHRYVRRVLDVPPDSLGLDGTNRRSYVQVMRRVWLAARVSQHRRQAGGDVDIAHAVADTLLAHMGVGVEHEKYQRMFQHLRDTEDAVAVLASLPHSLSVPTPADSPLVDEPDWMPALAREMVRGHCAADVPVCSDLHAVDRVQSLYSRDYTASVPVRYLSVWEYHRRRRRRQNRIGDARATP